MLAVNHRRLIAVTPRLAPRRLACAIVCCGLSWALLQTGAANAQEAPPEKQTFELGDEGFKEVAEPDPATPEGRLHAIRRAIAAGDPDDAEDLAAEWIEQFPNHPRRDEAYLLSGDAKAAQYHYFRALFDYEIVLRDFPDSPHFHTALERELRIADAFASGVKRRLWGMRIISAYGEAEELYIRIQERAPRSAIAEEAGIKLADYYYNRSEMISAATAYELFRANFPESQWAEHAMKRQIMANLATFKGPRFDATGLEESIRLLGDLKTHYPASAQKIGVDELMTRIDNSLATRTLRVAQWYDKVDKPVSAAFMYKRVIRDHPGSSAAQRALDRLRELDPTVFAELTPLQPVEGEAPADKPFAPTDDGSAPDPAPDPAAGAVREPDDERPDTDRPDTDPASQP